MSLKWNKEWCVYFDKLRTMFSCVIVWRYYGEQFMPQNSHCNSQSSNFQRNFKTFLNELQNAARAFARCRKWSRKIVYLEWIEKTLSHFLTRSWLECKHGQKRASQSLPWLYPLVRSVFRLFTPPGNIRIKREKNPRNRLPSRLRKLK